MRFHKQAQPWTRLLRLFCITLGALILSSCADLKIPVKIHDEPLYYIKGHPQSLPGDNYAVEMHFLTDGKTQLTKAEWDSISQGMVALPLSAFDDFNEEIAKLCSQVPCDYETQKKLLSLITLLHIEDKK